MHMSNIRAVQFLSTLASPRSLANEGFANRLIVLQILVSGMILCGSRHLA